MVVSTMLAVGGCGESTPGAEGDRRTPTVTTAHLAPTTIPAGWHVVQAAAHENPYPRGTPDAVLYPSAGWSGADDEPVLVVGTGDENAAPATDRDVGGFAAAAGVDPDESPFATTGHLGHGRGWTYVTWYLGDWFGFAAGRGLDEDVVLAAARATRAARAGGFPVREAPSILPEGTPEGFVPRARGWLTPTPREELTLRRAAPFGELRIRVGRPDPEGAAFARAWWHGGAPAFSREGVTERARTVGDATVTVEGPLAGSVAGSVADAILDSVVPVSPAAWDALGRRVLDLPADVALAGCGPVSHRFAGTDGARRWAIGLRLDSPFPDSCQVLVDATEGPLAAGGSSPLVGDPRAPVVRLGVGTMQGVEFLAGGVPMATTRVVVERSDGPPVAAVLGAPAFDPPRRTFAVAIAASTLPSRTTSVVAYDAGGREIARG